MFKEPEIVKILKEEEKIGKLKYDDFNIKERFFEIIGINQNKNHDKKIYTNISNYNDALKLARKIMRDIDKD